jgi:putative ABC transport system permease protein
MFIFTAASQAFEGVGIALDSLRANKIRAALTIMGVALGVFVVVAMSSVPTPNNPTNPPDLEASGPTSFFIYRRPIGGFTRPPEWTRSNPGITMDEVKMLERLPNIRAVTAHLGMRSSFKYKDRVIPQAGMEVYTPNWTDVDGGDIYPGRSFTYAENFKASRVALVNDKLAEQLFGTSEPLDKVIKINDVEFTVIGLYHYTASPMGTPTSGGQGDQPKAIIPYETGRRYLDMWLRGTDLIVKPRAGVTTEEAVDDVTSALRVQRGLRPNQPSNFEIVTQDRLWSIYTKLFGTFFVVGLALSSVGLLVGGVGVVAIMMISVTERTREIGVRKALGATRWSILWQFLVEAVTLTGIGASVGLALGMAVAIGVRTAWPAVPATTSWTTVAAALGISAVTGVLFGMLPAIRAARLDPVVALRYE